MTCDEVLGVIDAYLDGELSVAATLETHEHFAVCETCRRILESEAALHGLVAQAARADEVPAGLRDRVLGRIDTVHPTGKLRLSRQAARLGFVAALIVVAVLGWLVIERMAPHPLTPLTAELASKHLLYGEGRGAGLELVTSEPVQMGAWFEERLGFPVRLPALAQRPERLVGGRISSVVDAPAAYALYERNGQAISLFVTRRVPFARRGWTERQVEGAEVYLASLRGVALVWWEDKAAGRLYAAASAGDAEALVEFALVCINSSRDSKRESTASGERSRSFALLRERDLGLPAGHLLLDSAPDR